MCAVFICGEFYGVYNGFEKLVLMLDGIILDMTFYIFFIIYNCIAFYSLLMENCVPQIFVYLPLKDIYIMNSIVIEKFTDF